MGYTIEDLLKFIEEWKAVYDKDESIILVKDKLDFYLMHLYETVKKQREEAAAIDADSNLYSHAKKELELLGEDEDVIEGYLAMIHIFAAMGHSGGSASIFVPTLNDLLQFKNLMPLTNDPAEWQHVGEEQWGSPDGIWQSRRNSEAFSNDGGKHYYLLSEGGNDANRKPLHESEKANA